MKKLLVITLMALLFISACSENTSPADKLMSNPKEVKITSLEDLDAVFTELHYTQEDWEKGDKEVPRLTFEKVNPKWQEISENMPVENKKTIFLRLMLPLVLVSNERILQEREIVKSAKLTSTELIAIGVKYKVVDKGTDSLTKQQQQDLLTRVNTIPPSLALAQAAEESAWGTSRFALEGNAFFGQWDFSGNGIKPKQQRTELGNYGIKRFDSPLASVEGYMLNINSTSAYQSLRDLRAKEVAAGKTYSGTLLAGTLIKYSERGQAYIDGLRHLISYNKLGLTDDTYLSNNKLVHLVY
ncbi:glucosaminidase domain-containing protein [Psychromonas sp. 14N.309.X.WAT.B.A12]|uniref:glucosaminidase domain-containing protein n=1 Tax=Psychromonas sp. 14N.309.X.WAT.B.A12 TaxID=2998322 RepID=UPI0025AF4359|nr:glucosaminidase domain-containing protein [Psychromonas sp. 14N.309.X.WAT.B.A12]MDN2661756.1 glucosaminidase domain-containing protein [Psychromonas sp. 14N.309.X.WAT.B.A12]